jgi:hypothetical protein
MNKEVYINKLNSMNKFDSITFLTLTLHTFLLHFEKIYTLSYNISIQICTSILFRVANEIHCGICMRCATAPSIVLSFSRY